MSSSPRPLSKVLWFAVPVLALIGALVVFGARSVDPIAITAANAEDAQPAPAAGSASFSEDQKKEIEKIIKNYLVTNPEVFVEVQSALDAKLEKDQAEKIKGVISQNATDIYRAPNGFGRRQSRMATSRWSSSSTTTAATASAACTT